MTYEELVLSLLKQVADLTTHVSNQFRHIQALEKYISEQPGYNAARFGAIFQEFLTDPDRAAKDLKATQDRLSKLLKDFEAPPH